MSEKREYSDLCMGCMNPLPAGRGECGICGYSAKGDNQSSYLPVGTVLSERYVVGRLLEQVGDAAIYIGYDQVLKAAILIREYFPDTLAEREVGGELHIISGCENAFGEYYEKFRAHARALARMREISAIVAVYDIFEQNHTAYTISEYCEGNSLETRLRQVGGRMRWEEARPLFMPLLAAMISLHSAGIFHLGISPENLIICTGGRLRLQGFSIAEARRVSTDLRPHLLAGYSAPEQYAFGEETGAPGDVYGLAATIFRTLTGNPPPEGSRRARDSNDLYVPTEVASELPDYIAAALFNALQVNPENRTATMAEFRDQLSTAPAVSRLREDQDGAEDVAEDGEEDGEGKKDNRTKYALLIVLAVFVFLLLLAGTVVLLLFSDSLFGGDEEGSQITSGPVVEETIGISTTTRYQMPEQKYAVPDLMRQNYYDIREKNIIGDLKVEVEYMQYSSRPKGEILHQTPNPESPADEGDVIKVVISAGKEQIIVPDVSGWNYQHARLYLEALGFRVQEMRVVSDTVDIDIVESVSDAGKELPEGSSVTLRISETVQTTEEPTNWWE